jgi:metal-sulfur cluster biosynthetic enzyme
MMGGFRWSPRWGGLQPGVEAHFHYPLRPPRRRSWCEEIALSNQNLEEQVREALGQVMDPETRLSVMRMDLIHDLRVTQDGAVSLVFRPSSPTCPMAYSLANAIKKKVAVVKRVSSIRIRVENFERASHLENLLNSVKGKEA